jgi:ElaB/YqjD/DUF883 family membrane-anchored ribosome-binding protein
MTTQNVESEFDTVKADLAKLRGDIASLSAALKDVTSETVHQQIESIRTRIDNLTDDAAAHGRDTLDDIASHVEERPLTSILIALGVGFVVGRLLDR